MPTEFRDPKSPGRMLPTEEEFREFVKTLPEEQRRSTWIDYDKRMMAAGKARYSTDSKLAALGRGGLNFGMNFGAAAPGVAAVPSLLLAPLTAKQRDLSLSDAAAVNRSRAEGFLRRGEEDLPATGVAGRFAGAIAPGPANAIGRLGYRALGGAGARAAANAEGKGLSRVVVEQVMGAFAGSVGAIAALNAAEAPGDIATGHRSFNDVMADVVDQATNPVNLGLAGFMGTAQSLPRFAADPRYRDLVERSKAVLGPQFKAIPDMFSGPFSWMAGQIDALAKTTVGRRVASAWMDRSFWQPMNASIEKLRNMYGIGGGEKAVHAATEKGAQAIRRLLPTQENPKGMLAGQRSAIGRRIGASGVEVGPGPFDQLATILRGLDARSAKYWGSEGANSGGFSTVKRTLLDAVDRARGGWRASQSLGPHGETVPTRVAVPGEAAPIQVLENFRQQFGELAGFEQSRAGGLRTLTADLSPRDMREARQIYTAIRRLEGELDPSIDRGLKEIATLRGYEASLRQVANTANMGTDYELLKATFVGTNFTRRWDSLTRILPKERLQAIRGAYLANFLQDVELVRSYAPERRAALSIRAMENAWSGKSGGQYHSTRFDAILPGLRSHLHERGEISDLVLRSGVGRAEGSATSPRDDFNAVANAAMATAGNAAGLLSEPGRANALLSVLLGASGRLGLAETIINGRLRGFLEKTSTGKPVYPNEVVGPAIAHSGGAMDIGAALMQLGGSGIGMAASGAQGAFTGARSAADSLRDDTKGKR